VNIETETTPATICHMSLPACTGEIQPGQLWATEITHACFDSEYEFLAQLAELFLSAGQNAVSLCVCLGVNQGGTNCHRCTHETCNLACANLLMNHDRTPTTRSV